MPLEDTPVAAARPLQEFRGGVLAELPLALGGVPFGLIYGVLGLLSVGLPAWAVVAMCSVLFAGSSQIVFAQLWGAQAPPMVIGATVGVVNLRHALYSASIAPYVRELPMRWKLLLSYLLSDEAYAAAIGRMLDGPATPHRHWFLFGTGARSFSATCLRRSSRPSSPRRSSSARAPSFRTPPTLAFGPGRWRWEWPSSRATC